MLYSQSSYNTVLTLQAANMFVFGSSHSPRHGHNSNEVHQHCQPKGQGLSLSNQVAEPQSITIDSQIQEKSSSHLAAPCNSRHLFY